MTRTTALGRERIARKLSYSLPGGENPLRAAVWEFMRPMLSPILAQLNRDAFVLDDALESTARLEESTVATPTWPTSTSALRTPERRRTQVTGLPSRAGGTRELFELIDRVIGPIQGLGELAVYMTPRCVSGRDSVSNRRRYICTLGPELVRAISA